MLNRYFLLIVFLFSSFIGTVACSSNSSSPASELYCARSLKPVLNKIQQLPQVEQLIQQATEEGPVSIQENNRYSSKFEGYWSSDDRTIVLTKHRNTTEGGLISTMLFELHNAKRNKDFRTLDHQALRGEISKGEYVEAVEYIEYENALAVSALLDEGIEMGIFPRNSAWHPHRSFEDHYRLQRTSGHSKWIAKNYDMLFGY